MNKQVMCFLLQCGVLLVSVGIVWGTLSMKVGHLESEITSRKSDHDTLIIIVTKLDVVQTELVDIKLQIKELRNNR